MGKGGRWGLHGQDGVLTLPTLRLMPPALAWLQPFQSRVETGLGATDCSWLCLGALSWARQYSLSTNQSLLSVDALAGHFGTARKVTKTVLEIP